MEQEHFDPDFQEIYKQYLRNEEEESVRLYREIAPELTIRARRISPWWYAAAASVILFVAGTWALISDISPFRSKPEFTKAEVRESLENTIHALSACSKTVRQEFSRIEDLTAMTEAIRPAKKGMSGSRQKSESNTSKN